jgi:acyl-CoA synthetase (NDP forming)
VTDLQAFFNPRSIAIIGASKDTMAISGRPLRILQQLGYRGVVYPVNPKYEELLGVPVYPRIGAVPGPVDLALVAVPARAVPAVLEECAAAGVRHAMVFSSGFAEARGDEGQALQAEIRRVVERSSLRVCGPNCEGYFNATVGVPAGFSPAIDPERGYSGTRAGSVGIVAQSGGLGFALFNRGLELGLGFSIVISTGNEVDLEALDFFEYLVEDPSTKVMLGFVESFKRPRRLIEVARRAAEAEKPLVIAKIGRSEVGRRAAISHTGSLVGSDESYDAALRQLGVIRVDDVDELLDAASFLSSRRLPAGRRVAVLTASGGSGAWLAESFAVQGLELPEPEPAVQEQIAAFVPTYGSTSNPVDITAQAIGHGGLERALGLLTRSERFDSVAVVTTLAADNFFRQFLPDLRQVIADTDRAVLYYSYTTPKPAAAETLRELGVPCYTTPGRAARALAWACWYRDFLARRGDVGVWGRGPLPPGRVRVPPSPAGRGGGNSPSSPWWGRAGGRGSSFDPDAFLEACAIPRPAAALAHSVDEAVAFFRKVEGPAALKIQSPDLPHKSDVGGVRLGLASEAAVRSEYAELLATVQRARPEARLDGVLVQAMVSDGVETILGARVDPDLGPFVLVGLGGVFVEVLRDVALRLAPVSTGEAKAMVESLRGAPLLRGARGAPTADEAALVEAIVRFSRAAAALPADVATVEINPLLVRPAGQGVAAVDVRVEWSPRE